jgi:hypothetical protein
MADIDACILRLRNLGYKARMPGPLPELPGIWKDMEPDLSIFTEKQFIIGCDGYTVTLDERYGVSISPLLPVTSIILDKTRSGFTIRYPFDSQSFFFEMEDDAFVETVINHAREASEVVSALPARLKPTWGGSGGRGHSTP